MHVRDSYLFRVTRDADLDLQEDEADDLLRAIESELRRRRFGEPVRLESSAGCPSTCATFCATALELERGRLLRDRRHDGAERPLADRQPPGYEQLRDKPFMPAIPKRLIGATDIFALIREGDILLHHPVRSFDPVVQFVQQAAEDPEGARDQGDALPHVGQELADRARAARRGRERETSRGAHRAQSALRRREQHPVGEALERAGAHVVYGFANQKTHAKTLLVVRDDEDGMRRYMHFGTGNYNEKTARSTPT